LTTPHPPKDKKCDDQCLLSKLASFDGAARQSRGVALVAKGHSRRSQR
jgi:hypothetical protein